MWLICNRIFFEKTISLITSLCMSERGQAVAQLVETLRYTFSQN
jgi:hypothetical protein